MKLHLLQSVEGSGRVVPPWLPVIIMLLLFPLAFSTSTVPLFSGYKGSHSSLKPKSLSFSPVNVSLLPDLFLRVISLPRRRRESYYFPAHRLLYWTGRTGLSCCLWLLQVLLYNGSLSGFIPSFIFWAYHTMNYCCACSLPTLFHATWTIKKILYMDNISFKYFTSWEWHMSFN